jgi:hypothetical protein
MRALAGRDRQTAEAAGSKKMESQVENERNNTGD